MKLTPFWNCSVRSWSICAREVDQSGNKIRHVSPLTRSGTSARKHTHAHAHTHIHARDMHLFGPKSGAKRVWRADALVGLVYSSLVGSHHILFERKQLA
jgi:hypothetical protein